MIQRQSELPVRARPSSARKPCGREGGGQAADEDLLGPEVERRDQVDGPLVGGLGPSAEVRPKVQAGLADDGLADPGELVWSPLGSILSIPASIEAIRFLNGSRRFP